MELTVRHAWKREVDIPDLVRIHSSHRGGIENETVCKVTNRRISRYVVVKGLGTGFCDLGPNFVENHYSDLRLMYVSLGEPARTLGYIKTEEKEQEKIADYLIGSIFMNADTRDAFNVGVNNAYQFELDQARLLGNCFYFIRHPDRYVKLMAWVTAIAFVLGIVGYTFKDWLAALLSTPSP